MARDLAARLRRIEEATRRPPQPDLVAEATRYGTLVSSSAWHRAYEGSEMIDGVGAVVSTLMAGGLAYQLVGVRISLL